MENVTFRNYEDNATRKTGALSYLMYTSAGVSTENAIERAKFINAKPVYFPPMERKWGNDNLNGVAWKAAAIHDKDGSVGGIPNSYILLNDGVYDSIATDATACEIKSDWNAAVCKGDIGRLTFGGAGGPPRVGGPCSSGPGRLAQVQVLAQLLPEPQVPVVLVLPAHLLVEAAGAVQLLSRQSFSAAMAGSTPNREQRKSRYRDQGDHRKADHVHQPDGNGCRLVGDLRAAGIHHRSLGYASKAAWMRCARPATRPTTRTRMHSGSRSSPMGTVLAAPLAAALVVEPASRSIGSVPLRFLVIFQCEG